MNNRWFRNSLETGEALAARLTHYKNDANAIVLGLPKDGGIAVADAISKTLSLPVHVFITRKLRAPCDGGCALGAITETGVVYIDENVLCTQNCLRNDLRAYLEYEIGVQKAEILLLKHLLRHDNALPDLKGRTVILVDDGAPTKAILFAAIDALRQLGVRNIVAVIPTGPATLIREILHKADELVTPVMDEEIAATLKRSA